MFVFHTAEYQWLVSPGKLQPIAVLVPEGHLKLQVDFVYSPKAHATYDS